LKQLGAGIDKSSSNISYSAIKEIIDDEEISSGTNINNCVLYVYGKIEESEENNEKNYYWFNYNVFRYFDFCAIIIIG